MISSDHTCLQKKAASTVTYLVGTVLPTLTLQVAGEVSVLAILHDDHQGPCMEKNPKMGQESEEFHQRRQDKQMSSSPPGFVQAPSRLTTLR